MRGTSHQVRWGTTHPARGSRWRAVLVPLVAVSAVAAFAYRALSGGDEGKSTPRASGEASAAAKAEAARLPRCTAAGRSINFSVFTLGPRFAGLKQSDALRRCDRPELAPPGVGLRYLREAKAPAAYDSATGVPTGVT